MSKLRMDDDFRSALEAAVAFRMVEMYNNMDSEEAQKRVHDVAIHGGASPYSHQVVAAGYDLLQPVVAQALPFLRALLQQTVIEVQTQVERGKAAE